MGEIIYSICVGGFLVVCGIVMYAVLAAEEKKLFGDGKQQKARKVRKARKARKEEDDG